RDEIASRLHKKLTHPGWYEFRRVISIACDSLRSLKFLRAAALQNASRSIRTADNEGNPAGSEGHDPRGGQSRRLGASTTPSAQDQSGPNSIIKL
ncbi:MAG: hypothetical protein WA626_02935, partial [Acidobacteriaceae bacterium]